MSAWTRSVSAWRSGEPKTGAASWDLDRLANARRSSGVWSKDPIAPSAGVGMNARTAVSAVRTDHEGCQCSGWCAVMERQIFVCVSNRPLGVRSTNEGGLNGYSAGSRMRPW